MTLTKKVERVSWYGIVPDNDQKSQDSPHLEMLRDHGRTKYVYGQQFAAQKHF